MDVEVLTDRRGIASLDCDAVVVGLWSDETFTESTRQIDEASKGVIRGLLERKEATGKLFELTSLHCGARRSCAAHRVGRNGGRRALRLGDGFYRAAAAAARSLSAKRAVRWRFFWRKVRLSTGIGRGWPAPSSAARGRTSIERKRNVMPPPRYLWRRSREIRRARQGDRRSDEPSSATR